MRHHAGQLSGRRSLAIAIALAAVLASVVALCNWLVPRGTAAGALDAPAEGTAVPGLVECPGYVAEPLRATASGLIDCPRLYDGAAVSYRGEVVAAVLRRGERAWVHLNDDPYALEAGPLAVHRTALGGNAGIAVSIPADVADAIEFVGGATAQGDIVEVVGRFLRADPADGGGPTIQASSAWIVARGRPVAVQVLTRRAVTAGALTLVTLLVLCGLVGSRRRSRR